MTVTIYQHRAEEFEAQRETTFTEGGVRVDADAGRTTSVVVRNGVAVADTSSVQRATSSQLNPNYEDGTVFATAKNPTGWAVTEIKPETLITVNGVQAPVKFFESQGLIHRGSDGTYAEGPGDGAHAEAPAAEPEADTSNDLSMPEEVAHDVDRAFEGVADQHVEPLVATGIALATGQLDRSVMVRKMVTVSGVSPEEAEARISFVMSAYQQQADSALTHRCGIAEGDLGSFYAWAKESQPAALRDAVQKQAHAYDLSGYRALATRFMAENPPPLEAVKAAGYETRRSGDREEVFVDSRWMTVQTAARLGYF